MKIVLDTNVLVSALLKTGSKPARVLDLVLEGNLGLLVDRRILEEYRGVLSRPKFSIPEKARARVLNYLRRHGEQVLPERLEVELPDPNDLPLLEVAVSGSADALVTGNTRHFPSQKRQGITVTDPAGFLKLWDARRAQP